MIALFRSLFAPPRHLILLLAALWLGLTLAEKRSEENGISRDELDNLVYYSLFGYILGGRILFALANDATFAKSPLSLFSLNLDLFDPWAALVVAFLAGLIYGHRRKLLFWSTLDALTPLFAVLAIGLALTHLAAGTAFGSPTNLPWAMNLWNARRHPSQVYELLVSLLIFGWLWFRARGSQPGLHFLTFVALTAGAQLFLEAFRGDSVLIAGGFRLAQVVAWVILIVAFVMSESIREAKPHA